MNTYPLIPQSSIQEFRARLNSAVQRERDVTGPELRHALGALTEDDGEVDEFESSSAGQVLVSDGFSKVATAEARELARAFVAGTIPAVSDRWTQGLQQQFDAKFVRRSPEGWVQLPADSRLPSRSLESAPPEVRAAVNRYQEPGRASTAAAHQLHLAGADLFVVHAREDGSEQLSIYDATGCLVTWGSGDLENGFFWED